MLAVLYRFVPKMYQDPSCEKGGRGKLLLKGWLTTAYELLNGISNKLAKGWLPWFIGCTNCSKQTPFPKLLKGVFILFLVA